MPTTHDFQLYQCRDMISFGSKSRRAQYGGDQKNRKDEKNKRNTENEKGERRRKNHRGNKVNLMVEKSSGSKIGVHYHIIYWCYQELIVLR